MDSQDEHEEIIQGLKVMVYGFVSKGIIPSSALDVINNKLQPDRINLFLSFGVDLRVVLSCIPLEPNVQVVKVEKDADPSSEDFDANFIKQNVDVKLEIGEVPDEDEGYDHDTSGVDNEVKDESYYDDDYAGGTYEDDEDYEEKADVNDYEPPAKVPKKSKSSNGGKANKSTKCIECNEMFPSCKSYLNHRIEFHYFNNVRALVVKRNKDSYEFLNKKSLMATKEKLKNHFHIQIPPPDFTKEDFEKCIFPKPIEEYVMTSMASKLKRHNGKKVCASCNAPVKNLSHLQEHLLRCHRLKFRCPYDDCTYNKRARDTLFIEFAKHYYYVSSIFR